MQADLSKILMVVLCVTACSSPAHGPQSSSSSHWLECRVLSDCAGAPNAVACRDGYCVDAAGKRIATSASTALSDGGSDANLSSDGGGELNHDAAGGDLYDARINDGDASTSAADGGGSTLAAGHGLSVRVNHLDGSPLVGMPIYFSDASGALVDQRVTDANGLVERAAATPTVTLDFSGPDTIRDEELLSYFGVEEGDRLVLQPVSLENVENVTVYTASFATPQPADTGLIFINGGPPTCTSLRNINDDYAVVDWEADCIPLANNSLVAYTKTTAPDNDPAKELNYYAWAKDVPRNDDGTPAPAAFSAWQAASSCEVIIANLPNNLTQDAVNTILSQWSGQSRAFSEVDWSKGVPIPPLLNASFYIAKPFANDLEVASTISAGPDEVHTLHGRQATADTIGLDWNARLRPPSAASVSVNATSGAATVSWTPSPDAARADVALLKLAVSFETTTEPGYDTESWDVFVAPGQSSITLPTLPAGRKIAAVAPATNNVQSIDYMANDQLASYAAFRAAPLTMDDRTAPVLVPRLDARGSAQHVSWTAPQP